MRGLRVLSPAFACAPIRFELEPDFSQGLSGVLWLQLPATSLSSGLRMGPRTLAERLRGAGPSNSAAAA